ncbi:MAG: hypothetical protein LBO63_07880 [Oscillospiraceae bacterium]|jgi:hypothetical protein|nr:hypothetical protein [Oscillospiraceae bacterium]
MRRKHEKDFLFLDDDLPEDDSDDGLSDDALYEYDDEYDDFGEDEDPEPVRERPARALLRSPSVPKAARRVIALVLVLSAAFVGTIYFAGGGISLTAAKNAVWVLRHGENWQNEALSDYNAVSKQMAHYSVNAGRFGIEIWEASGRLTERYVRPFDSPVITASPNGKQAAVFGFSGSTLVLLDRFGVAQDMTLAEMLNSPGFALESGGYGQIVAVSLQNSGYFTVVTENTAAARAQGVGYGAFEMYVFRSEKSGVTSRGKLFSVQGENVCAAAYSHKDNLILYAAVTAQGSVFRAYSIEERKDKLVLEYPQTVIYAIEYSEKDGGVTLKTSSGDMAVAAVEFAGSKTLSSE